MNTFAFIIHPLDVKREVGQKYPRLARFPTWAIEAFLATRAPFVYATIGGIESKAGGKVQGMFVVCPLSPRILMKRPKLAYARILQCCHLAHQEGAQVVGLGAYTACSGDGGVTLNQPGQSPIPVTTGNSYTVYTALEGALMACEKLSIVPEEATLAVVGATGSIGRACAWALAHQFRLTYLIGRDQAQLDQSERRIHAYLGTGDQTALQSTTSLGVLRDADVILVATSSPHALIHPEHLKPGSIVVDVSRPRNVSARVAKERPDVLVVDGGIVSVPGELKMERKDRPGTPFGFGFPPKTLYACMSETAILALEGHFQAFTLGKEILPRQIDQISLWAGRHGFRLAGLRAFEKPITEEQIARVSTARIRAGREQVRATS